ncbi:Uncharacterised protein [Vibrio cholerae]|nr:Uncharacterised protein [Vibrio cholerae]
MTQARVQKKPCGVCMAFSISDIGAVYDALLLSQMPSSS